MVRDMNWRDFLNEADLLEMAAAKAKQREGVRDYRRVYERARKRMARRKLS